VTAGVDKCVTGRNKSNLILSQILFLNIMKIDLIIDSTRKTIDKLINNLGMLWPMGGNLALKMSPG